MPNATYNVNLQAAGSSVQKSIVRTGDSQSAWEVSLPKAQAGNLSTRTDNTSGTITADSGSHGIATADVVDVYWSGGMRYGVTVGTVSGTSIPISGGSGDNLPVATTTLTVVKQVDIVAAIDGDNLQIIGISLEVPGTSTAKGHVDMQDSGSSTIAELDLTINEPLTYDIAGGVTNPFTGNPIAEIKASNGDSANDATLKILALSDSTV
jgi:hypothetical protein